MAEIKNLAPVLVSLVRRVMPELIATDLVGVQPMSLPAGFVFDINNRFIYGQPYYVTKQWELDGKRWYLLELNDQVKAWITETFTETVDYSPFTVSEGREGTVVGEETYMLIKLKWS